MLQAIEVLALPTADLDAWLSEQAEANEALSLDSPLPRERRGSQEDTAAHDEMLRNQPDERRSLSEEVESQLVTLDLSESRVEWVRYLISTLDDGGYLSMSDEELLAGAPAQDPEALAMAIADLQTLEPRGLGARGAIEALLLQLDPEDEDYGALCRLLEEFLEELAKNRLPGVAKAMDLELEDLERLLAQLKDLDPRPVAGLIEVSAPTLRADVVVLPVEQGFEVELARGALPAVSIDEDLRTIAKDKNQSQDVRDYARTRVDSARAIVDAVAQRGETLLRVSQRIFAHQREYLTRGPGHLKALSMTDLAVELDLHVSTVSRTVAGKYVQTPFGIESLRGFFQQSAGGSDAARTDVREQVKAVFDGEDKSAPLSDDDVVEALAKQGVQLARRTVAKYRRELGIPSSYKRRRFS